MNSIPYTHSIDKCNRSQLRATIAFPSLHRPTGIHYSSFHSNVSKLYPSPPASPVAQTPAPSFRTLSSSGSACHCYSCYVSWCVSNQRDSARTVNRGCRTKALDIRCTDGVSVNDFVEQEPPTSPAGPSYRRRYQTSTPDQRQRSGTYAVAVQGFPMKPPPVHPASKTPAPEGLSRSRVREIEIMPGVSVPVRGSQETQAAIMSGNYERVDCLCCESALYVIRDAGYVLCPTCKVISSAPMRGDELQALDDREFDEEVRIIRRIAGGVGLGFDLAELQFVFRQEDDAGY